MACSFLLCFPSPCVTNHSGDRLFDPALTRALDQGNCSGVWTSGHTRTIGRVTFQTPQRTLLLSFEVNLAGAKRAVVDVEKLRDYCLNLTHHRGRHKARVFASALRILQSDADWLRARLLNAALLHDATEVDRDEYGGAISWTLNVSETTSGQPFVAAGSCVGVKAFHG